MPHLRFMLIFSPRWLFLVPGIFLTVMATLVTLFLCWQPVQAFDVGTELVCAMAIIGGLQMVSLACFTKVFGIAEGLLPQDPAFSKVFRFLTLERGIAVGLTLMLAGFGLVAHAVWVWHQAGFGALSYAGNLRLLVPGLTAVIPIPTYSMYRVVSEQRGAAVIAVPRLGPDLHYGLDVEAVRRAARDAALVWLCNPNNPTGRAELPGTIERLLALIAADATAKGRRPPAVAIDEAYAEFSGETAMPLLGTYPDLVVIRTASKAYALAGLRVGFGLARRETLEKIEPYRPPGSVSTVSVTVVTEALRDRGALEANIERIEGERARLAAELTALGWAVEPSVTNFLLVGFGTPERAEHTAEAMLRRGLVPRTFPQGHPLNAFLRFTVRAPGENDRLITAARETAAEETAA